MYWRNVSSRGLGKAVVRAGLDEEGKPNLRFHDLRHTYASMLIGQGEDVTYVASQLGHPPKITLDVYARLFDRQARAQTAKARMESAHGKLLGAATDGAAGSVTPLRKVRR
jgi:integrase